MLCWLTLLVVSVSACGGQAAQSDASVAVVDGGVLDSAIVDQGSDMTTLDANGVTTLRVHHPLTGHTLSVRGGSSPLDWTKGKPMVSVSDGVYQYQVTLPPTVAQLEWKPLVDDSTWSRGPNYVAVRGATVDVYPHFFTQAGTVKKLFASFHSTALNNDRVVWVYLPPSYDENPLATFPVVYMQDGQNLFAAGVFGDNGWRVEHTLDAGAEDGSIREIIVVGPEVAAAPRWYEYTPTVDASEMKGGSGDRYLTMLVDELKPQVDAMLRTRPERAATGILGSSLGGLISAYAGCKKADTFALVGEMSPSTWWDNEVILADVAAMTAPSPDKIYIDYDDDGLNDDGDGGDETDMLIGAYVQKGYVVGQNLMKVVQPGGMHSEMYWAQRLPGALGFLFGKRP